MYALRIVFLDKILRWINTLVDVFVIIIIIISSSSWRKVRQTMLGETSFFKVQSVAQPQH